MNLRQILDAMSGTLCKRCLHPVDIHEAQECCTFKIPFRGWKCNCGGNDLQSCTVNYCKEPEYLERYRGYFRYISADKSEFLFRDQFLEKYGWSEDMDDPNRSTS